MIECHTVREMRTWSRGERGAGRRVALVPTMGFLHEGHLRLVDRARGQADVVVLSVFVNPTQFGPGEDFERYPRDLERDRALAAARGVDCLFAPPGGEVYPSAPVLQVDPGPLAAHLCGPGRPGHFAGVLLVVAKLFNIVEPDVAVFGRKDAQQAVILQRLARDLNFPVEVVVGPTVREPDGLALSSRNVYLTPAHRAAALAIPRALAAGHAAWRDGARGASAVLDAARAVLSGAAALDVEYVEVVDPDGLAPVDPVPDDAILAIAARVGGTRLIDNIAIGQGPDADERLDD